MSETFDHESWLSPYTWRYGSDDMRRVWSQNEKRRTWRRIWVALANTQSKIGLVKPEQVADLRAHKDEINIERAHELEAELRHDLMAEVHTYAEQCTVGAGIIHLGATSMDVEDNADAMRLANALDIIVAKVEECAKLLADRIDETADDATMAFTHLQPAEPTTVGYRLAQYGQDLLEDLRDVRDMRAQVRGKGFKGAVGTSASYMQLLEGTGWTTKQFEADVMAQLDIEPFEVATQTAPRKQEYRILNALASLGQTLYRYAADLRLLQSPPIGEWAEPFGKKQIGSSAMPFKRNPINAENMNSTARHLAALPKIAWDNAAHLYLERTLDDSCNRRSVLPEAFLMTDELLKRFKRLITGMSIDAGARARLLDHYGVFAATERVLMELVRRGGNRQELHEVIREHSLDAWAAIRNNEPNLLATTLSEDPAVTSLATTEEVLGWLVAADYVGDAPERARNIASTLRSAAGDQA